MSQNPIDESLGQLGESIRQLVKSEIESVRSEFEGRLPEPGAATPGESATAVNGDQAIQGVIDRAGELFQSDSFKGECNKLIESAFQKVLPQLVKRFRDEIEQRLGSGGGGNTTEEVIGSDAMKELLDEKFRHMLMYLKQDVIPKAVQQVAAS